MNDILPSYEWHLTLRHVPTLVWFIPEFVQENLIQVISVLESERIKVQFIFAPLLQIFLFWGDFRSPVPDIFSYCCVTFGETHETDLFYVRRLKFRIWGTKWIIWAPFSGLSKVPSHCCTNNTLLLHPKPVVWGFWIKDMHWSHQGHQCYDAFSKLDLVLSTLATARTCTNNTYALLPS